MQSLPLDLVLELVRAEQAGDPYAFRFAPQDYLLRRPGGGFESARFEWDAALLADLSAVRQPERDPAIAARLGEALRRFLAGAGWADAEAQLVEAVRGKRPICVTLRFAAAELFALPWELLTLKSSGQHLGELPGVLLRYEWPETTSAIVDPSMNSNGRILFAWSAAAGAVPAEEQLAAIEAACQQGFHPFDRERDVIANLSADRLVAALEAAKADNRPIAVLHILCHGASAGSTYGLALDGPSGGAAVVDAGQLRQLLAPYADMVRLVVLCACDSGNSGALGNQLGSAAQTLHRAGIAAVVASRYPLSVAGSRRLTAALYDQLLAHLSSLEGALCMARTQLLQEATALDWASLQLYARAADGNDTRPITFRPFRGLLAFQPQHHRFFFGREPVIDEICHDLAQLETAHLPRLLIVTGASGTGKSSVVLAGALPRLCAANSKLRTCTLRPGSEPEATLSQALQSLPPGDAPNLLIVDQLEELFTHTEQDAPRQTFARRLWQLASAADSQVSIIATLRVDFIGRCGELVLDAAGKRLDAVAYDEAHRVFVAQMAIPSLRQAIEEPARLCGLMLEEGLAQRMIGDVGGEPGALPLLEDTLDLLWQRRHGRTLTQAAYDEVGGVAGALHGRADALVTSFSAAEKRAVRRLFVRLVNVAEDITLSTRRRVQLMRLRPGADPEAAIFDRVLARLIDARLLVRDGEGAAQLIEVAHETLIRKWAQLAEWVKVDRKMLAALERIDAWVREWNDLGTLLVSSQIGFVEQFIKDYPDDCPQEARKLLAQSHELARRRQRTRKWVQGGFALASLILALLGGYGLHQARLVARTASASRDAARMNAVRTMIGNAPADSLGLLREIEADDLERIPGYWPAAVELLRNVAEEEESWQLAVPDHASGRFAISADCAHIAVVSRLHARVLLFDKERLAETLPLDAEFSQSLKGVPAVALSGDARSLAVFSDGQPVPILRLDTQRVDVTLPPASGRVTDAGFSLDGAQVLALDDAKLVHVWKSDGSSGPSLLPLHAYAPPDALSLRAEGFILATRTNSDGDASTAELWSAKRHQTLLFDRRVPVRDAALCADRQRVATVSSTGKVQLWRLGRDPAQLGMFALPVSPARAVRFSSDGQKIAVALPDGTLQIWNSDGTGNPLILNEPLPIQDFYPSPDFRRLLIVSTDHSARIRNIDGAGAPLELPERYLGLFPIVWGADGRRVLIRGIDSKPHVLNAESGEVLQRLDGVALSSSNIVFSPDGSKLAWLNIIGYLRILDLDAPQRVLPKPRILVKSPGHAPELAFSADSKQVVVWDGINAIRSISVQDGSETQLLQTAPREDVVLSPHATHFAVLVDRTLKIGALLGRAPLRSYDVFGLWGRLWTRFSEDDARFMSLASKYMIVGTTDGTGALTKLPLERPEASQGMLSPDGKLAMLIGPEGTPTIWNLDVLNSLRPAVLRRRMWETDVDCPRMEHYHDFLNLTYDAANESRRSCEAMLKCIKGYRTAPQPHDGYAACLKEFRAKQGM